MSGHDEEVSREEALRFFGGVTAAMSHDLRNVLATINEYAGLLEDLQYAASKGKPLQPEQLQTVCSRISAQVERGHAVLGRLSRFSHLVDPDGGETSDIGQLVAEACALSQRRARMAQVELTAAPCTCAAYQEIDRFGLVRAVCLAIRLAFDGAADARRVGVQLCTGQGACDIVVTADDGLPDLAPEAPEVAALREQIEALGGTMQWEDRGRNGRIVLSLR